MSPGCCRGSTAITFYTFIKEAIFAVLAAPFPNLPEPDYRSPARRTSSACLGGGRSSLPPYLLQPGQFCKYTLLTAYCIFLIAYCTKIKLRHLPALSKLLQTSLEP